MTESSPPQFLPIGRDAMTAVDSLWDSGGKTFWRDTAQRTREVRPKKKLYPTVTCRCTEELVAAAKVPGFAVEESRLEEMASAVIGIRANQILSTSDLGYESFTLAQAVACCARIAASPSTSFQSKGGPALEALVPELLDAFPTRTISGVHPFVRFHTIRALGLASDFVPRRLKVRVESKINAIIESVRRDTGNLLARHHTGLITPAEHVVLAFCAVILSHTPVARDHKTALAALDASVSAQDEVGCWPLGRVVREEASRLEISTYEVAWAVSVALRQLIEIGICDLSDASAERTFASVIRAGNFAKRSAVEVSDGIRGWASDHPYQRPRVESWTSAIVLQFALAAEDLREEAVTRSTLTAFNVVRPSDDQWPQWLNWAGLSDAGEPSQDFPVYEYVQSHLIDPIRASPLRLPSGIERTASALLFGPPGTSKTTVVQAVAQALEWPLVRLNPGSFLEKGLEAIESEARAVFDLLQRLRRAVVLFDECDELFRDRNPNPEIEAARTISAFVTASMLPKLQDLHDTGRVLFFVCTNHVNAMDPAVLRGGRIDHRIGVGPPDERARTRILETLPAETRNVRHGPAAMSELAKRAERFSRGELLRAGQALLASPSWSTRADAVRDAKRKVEAMTDSLTISNSLYQQFLEDQAHFSDVYLERR